jgi:hypothetical protein
LIVSAVSSSQVNLSWSASTDNVAVSGYRVERCQGAACSNFSQIATPAGTTYNDTGLTGSTSNSYRVRATDAAGNLGSYSVAGTTTTAQGAISVQLSPVRGGATVSQSLSFTTNLQNDISSAGMTWNSSAGSFSSKTKTTATFVVPNTATSSVTVTATSVADSSKSATATIAVTDLAGVFTYHNDNSRTGANLQEFALTTSNVNATTFGKLFSCTVDAAIYAQPLWVANQMISGGTHNVLYVATEKNSVYAFDADSTACQILWQKSLNPSGETFVLATDESGCGDLAPNIGITGTPVINPATGTLYAVSKTTNTTSPARTVFHQRLHALDLATGTEKFTGPRDISASVPGTGTGGTGSVVSFDPSLNGQRPALLLTNGHVIISWASHCDFGSYLGWAISYSANALAQEAIFNASPNGTLAGIWMAGNGPAADSNGNIYFATGNGMWDGSTNFGDSIVKLGPPSGGSFGTLDFFTPTDQQTLDNNDWDLGSGGVLLLPDLVGPIHLLVQAGKEGTIYVVNRDNLGQMCSVNCSSGDTQIVQELTGALSGMWGSPSYWNGHLYFGGASDNGTGDVIKAFSVTTGAAKPLSTSPTSKSAHLFNYPGPTPSVSANNTSNGIVWALENSAYSSGCPASCQVVYAYDATNLGTLLYTSSEAALSRDRSGGAVKFTVPTVANGKVYVGGQTNFTVYGLLPN